MYEVFHFELHVDNSERAMVFYGNSFGWRFTRREEPGYWHIATGPQDARGVDGELVPRLTPGCTAVPVISVGSIDECLKKVTELGGEIVRRMTSPGAGYLAHCRDTEGNIFAVLEYDDTAS